MTKFDILQNNKVDNELAYIAATSEKAIAVNKEMWLPTEIFFLGPQILIYLVIIFVFYYGGNAALSGEMSLSFFYGVVSSLFLLQWTLSQSLGVLKDISKDRADVERLRELVDTTPSINGIDKWKKLSLTHGDIVFDSISYGYGEGTSIFENFSLHITGKKKTALVGSSGAGKSTLIKLIAGYIHPLAGVINIDGQPLPTSTFDKKAISLKSYYKHIGYLTQEPNVFDGSIYDNLTYALDHKPTKQELDTAIQQSQCQFILDFKNWLQTEIGERGIRLSGGQRQRLAIAKIFLKNPEIVLLDEPTSALDSLSEEAITKAMHNLFKWRTVVIIAHRLQTVKHADDIIVLEGGKIIERGTHTELVEQGGHYAKMLELQSWF